ncbi:Leucine-rich repeat receptor-like serine/threonine/tyrosine-protein kinase sobir1 [Stylosanthes scabra]|uniref:Leucine-rich repeat receptor-like serine/threonine/tyrosine-protein kinase sobir1 n=1 Tax=Stylosanthes scabra TaxID=79078 RepID=A0ABU6RU80_9FABA|nr:Leucine-rich repeat receptor-like serine/threonine/tyrosine-protein kinase sobir1 [Stylosanthes scabra]
MATQNQKNRFFLFLFLFLLFSSIIKAKLDLHPSDFKAFKTLQTELGLSTHLVNAGQRPCSINGVFCERRLSNNGTATATYFLRITRLVFTSKNLHGSLSSAIGELTELKELTLSNNHIVDRIPTTIVNLKNLEILDLGNNGFSGEVPAHLSSLARLRILDVSDNKFSGNLNFLKYFPNMEKLNIANNLFVGHVPLSIRSFRNLRQFNFSGNSFLEDSTEIVKSFTGGEDFHSVVPRRFIFFEDNEDSNDGEAARAPSSISYKKRRRNYYPSTTSSPAPAPAAHHHHHHNRRKILGWILGFLAGSFAGTITGFIFSLLFKVTMAMVKRGRKGGAGPDIFSPLIKKAEDLAFLEKEDGLANLELIGKGGSGEVFKAELPGSDGKMIAIKKIIQPPKDISELAEEDSKLLHKKMRQIRSEINTVGHIRHRNLLPLLAHVSRPDSHLLVYEFMKNGSLQDLLNKVQAGEAELDWLSRHRIAIGVASGLEYLHMNHTPKIIHRDLKPGNILLDDDMEARIADFGLAKAMPDAQTHITTSKIAGTVGYIAPEYHLIFKFSDKCDIFSLGVVLGVLVTGKFPSDEFFQHTDEMSIVKWMKKIIISETPKEAIDPKLIGNGFEEQMLLVLKIACFCTMDDPKERPNSKDVRCMLAQIKH